MLRDRTQSICRDILIVSTKIGWLKAGARKLRGHVDSVMTCEVKLLFINAKKVRSAGQSNPACAGRQLDGWLRYSALLSTHDDRPSPGWSHVTAAVLPPASRGRRRTSTISPGSSSVAPSIALGDPP